MSAGCVAALGLTGCSGAQGRASGEQRSIAEYDLARDAFQNGRMREALEHVGKALELNQENADASYLGAIVMLAFCAADETSSDCRYEEAEHFARQALESSSDFREAKNTLGVILIQQGRYNEAIDVLKPLAEDLLYGSPEKAWGNLGLAYLKKGQLEDAIACLKRSVSAQPLFCVGHYRLGLAFSKKNQLQEARQSFSQAVEVAQPECAKMQDAFFERAQVLSRLGMIQEAIADYERCREIASNNSIGKRCNTQLQTLH